MSKSVNGHRTREKSQLTALDLFSGAGGLSEGFRQAGFNIAAAVEIDAWAATTFEHNHPSSKVFRTDATQLTDDFYSDFSSIDAVIGGPPCQGFSISASNRRAKNDPRNLCYRDFLRAVAAIQPPLVLIENVKEFSRMVDRDGRPVLQEVIQFLDARSYYINWGILNAKFFGIPQERIRLFVLASKYHKPSFPLATHAAVPNMLERNDTITLWDAISDLPKVTPRAVNEGHVFDYELEPQNPYQEKIRHGSTRIFNHVPMRHTDRVIERFAAIPIGSNGEGLPDNLKPRSKADKDEVSNRVYGQNHRRLNPNEPCSTITASFYSSFIHPFQNRNLTVREAARVQSFPDKFVFCGKKTRLSHKLLSRKGILEDVHLDQFNQVGNAVPPMLAKLLAESLAKTVDANEYCNIA